MHREPPPDLVRQLSGLGLVTEDQMRRVAPRVGRLAADLPDFESLWIDALAQARVLTPFQAARINGGAADTLVIGPYVVDDELPPGDCAVNYRAHHRKTGRRVRLAYVERPWAPIAAIAAALPVWLERVEPIADKVPGAVIDAGLTGNNAWAACDDLPGQTAASWMVENGRFPPSAVLHVARQMLAQLEQLEQSQSAHGGISAAGLLLGPAGEVAMPLGGLRPIVRPAEGFGLADLAPEAYDCVAPEQIVEGRPASPATDLYACGSLWWRMLSGRAPFAGGSGLAKLKATSTASLADIRHFAPDVPERLARVVAECLSRDPARRPGSAADLLERLGQPTRGGSAALASCLLSHRPRWYFSSRSRTRRRRRPAVGVATMVAALLILVAAPLAWLLQPAGVPPTQAASTERVEPKSTAGQRELADANSKTRQQPPPQEMTRPPLVDSQVRSASATAASPTPLREELLLPADRPTDAALLRFKSGQRVRGRGTQRPRVVIARQSLRIASEDVTFENIDFVWDRTIGESPAVIVEVQASAVTFRGCSFSGRGKTAPIAVSWYGPGAALAGVPGEIAFRDCVLADVTAVVDVQAAPRLHVRLENTLCVATGPIVRLARAPAPHENVAIRLEHVTTRGDSSVLECRNEGLAAPVGPIAIEAIGCALATSRRGALMVLTSPQPPSSVVESIRWTGAGSLVTPETVVLLWRSGANRQQALADDELDIGGLARSDVQFAGSAAGPPAASRVIDWQAPLRNDEPPGANPALLALPERQGH